MRFIIFAAVSFALAACVPTTTEEEGRAVFSVRSDFGSVSGNTVRADLSEKINRSLRLDDVGTVAYTVGIDPVAGQFVGLAGIASGSQVGDAIVGGTATYTADYAYTLVGDVSRGDTMISGRTLPPSGDITLTADFDAGTLTGSDTASSMTLSVDGTINGRNLGGRVTVEPWFLLPSNGADQLTATLEGRIGETGVIGVFHGSSSINDPLRTSPGLFSTDGSVVSGGFAGTRDAP